MASGFLFSNQDHFNPQVAQGGDHPFPQRIDLGLLAFRYRRQGCRGAIGDHWIAVLGYLQRAGKFVIVSVTDSGVGIDPQAQQRLFIPFQQVDASTTRRAGGTGLGLAISRSFVQMHGGEIWVESQPGRGSTFRFTLPTYGSMHGEAEADGKAPVAQAEVPAVAAGKDVILAVDDDPGVITLLKRYLEGDGSRVWENSWVRFPRGRLNRMAQSVFESDLRADRRLPGVKTFVKRLCKFNMVSLIGIGLKLAVFWLLTSVLGTYDLLFNLIGIAVATIWNYVMNTWWTWKSGIRIGRTT